VTIVDPNTGKRKENDRIIESNSKAEVIASQLALREQMLQTEVPRRVKLRDYATKWIERRKPRLKLSTWSRYEEHLARILDGLGEVYMDRLMPGMISDWLQAQALTLSGWSCHGALRVLRTLTRDAQVELGLDKWPCERVRPPKALSRYDEDRPNALTADELARLFVAMRDEEVYWFPLFATMAFTGLRFAEASALRWGDIDLDGGTLAIRRSQYRGEVGEPKTEGSRRRLPLVPELAAVLQAHREQLVRAQHPGLVHDWVFPSATGGLLTTGCLNKPIRRACVTAKIRHHLTAHGLRRTLNTLALQVASAETTRKILGHTTAAMTAHYNAPAMAEKREALGRVIQLVQPDREANLPRQVGIEVGIDAQKGAQI
jgi:integrase